MKKTLLFICLIMFCFTFVQAVDTTSVYYQVTVEYKPSCTTNYFNTTVGNQTYVNNVTNCYGMIEVMGIENNHLTVIENFSQAGWKKTFSGVKNAEVGNGTDISGIMARLDTYDICWNNLETCKDSNRNISAQLLMINEDIGFEANLSECVSSKNILQTKYDEKSGVVSEKSKEVEDLEGSLMMRGIIGFILGAIFYYFGLPKLQGKNSPKSEDGQGFHENPPV